MPAPAPTSTSSRGFHRLIPKSRLGRFLFLIFFGFAGVLSLATSAGAFYTSQGSGTGAAGVGVLNPPTSVIAAFPNADAESVDVSWVAPNQPDGIVIQGYYVQRYEEAVSSPACGTSPTSLIATVTCIDTDVPSGTYTYAVTAVFRSWTATSNSSGPVTVPAPILS